MCLLSDRDITGDGVEVEFFGETTTLPAGPATLALRSGAPLIPMAVYFRPHGSHLATIGPPIPTEREGRLRDDVARITQVIAHRFEDYIRAEPTQWHVMQPNWPSDRVPVVKVAMICPYSLSIPGGVQGQVLGLARALRELGHEARVLAPCDGPPPMPFVMSVGPSTKVESNGSISPIAPGKAAAQRTLEALRSFAPDVMHLHEPLVPGPTTAALLGTAIPSVGTFHMAAERRDSFYRFLRKPATGVAKRLTIRTAVSDDARRTAHESLGGSYWVLPNGVDVVPFAKAEPWPSPVPAVLFVGRHEPRKGLGVLLDAWQEIERDAVLWVASDGPETEALRARGVPAVEWLGRITDDEKASRMRGATIFCAPAVSGESFGVVLLEAMAADTAVVASDIPGYRNVARPDVEALMTTPGDAQSLRHALRRLLDDPDRRAELAAAGERRTAAFSMLSLAERFVPVYESAIACAPGDRT